MTSGRPNRRVSVSMSPEPLISNASPLIALHQIDCLTLLPRLFARVIIPPAVRREISPSMGRPTWIAERSLQQPIDPRVPGALGAGEREAISLALEIGVSRIVLDDMRARRRAESLGLEVIGTLGILVLAKRQRLIPAVRPLAEAHLAQGFFVSPSVLKDALATAAES
jgi:predicted nucleic acid-binding protein